MKHPEWYYKEYDQIFGRRKYSDEIDTINKICSFNDKNVIEIGAGTGNHAEQILRYKPKKLILIDNDIEAIKILNSKFQTYNNLFICHNNGFDDFTEKKYDRVLCLYSIIQQTRSIDEVLKRFMRIYELLKTNGIAIVELINYQVHFNQITSGKKRIFQKNKNSVLSIESINKNSTFSIKYLGFLGSLEIFYEIELVKINISLLANKLSNLNIKNEIHQIENNNRKVLFKLIK